MDLNMQKIGHLTRTDLCIVHEVSAARDGSARRHHRLRTKTYGSGETKLVISEMQTE